jgi:dihydroorotate dehydrogenase
MLPLLSMVKAYWYENKALPFPSFSIHVLKASGADALELNLSCPHGMGERGMGLACGQVRTLTAATVHVRVT